MNNLRFLFYTNERNQAFCDLCLDYFFKHCQDPNAKVSVISNGYNSSFKKHAGRVEYLDSATSLGDRYRFPLTMEYALSKIQEEYVFLFFDDYFLLRDVQLDRLKELLDFIRHENVDYFGFDELVGLKEEFKEYKSEKFPQFDGQIAIKPKEYMYLYSLQPSIWKKESLAKLFERNKEKFSIFHELDQTKQEIKDSTQDFKTLGSHLPSMFVSHHHYEHINNYFILAYIEITRSMVFSIPENGFANHPKDPVPQFIYELIKKEGLLGKQDFQHILSLYPLGVEAGVNDEMTASEIFAKVLECRKKYEN